jgi:hypothetical protein
MILLINAIALVWWHGMAVRSQWRTRIAHLVLLTIAGGLIVAPFALRYRTLETPELAEVVSLSADWGSYLVPAADTLIGRWWIANVNLNAGSIWGERTVFLGWLAIAMSVFGAIVLLVRRQWIRAGIALSCVLIGLVLSFGPSVANGVQQLSAFGMFTAIPGMSGFRVPARLALVVLLGVSLLAAEAARALVQASRYTRIALFIIWPLMLTEWHVVAMPNGRPPLVEIPAIYLTDEVRTARAIISLPDYRATRSWFAGADYLYYSTAHWRPIVNGFGRSEPPEHPSIISFVNAFPGPNNARRMREIGVEYIVVHGAAYPGGVEGVVREAAESGEYDLARQIGSDYLFRVRDR